jgi:hypothetical protein
MSITTSSLAKWWTTPSAQAAIGRATTQRRAKLIALRERIAEQKAKLHRQIWNGLTEQRHERK